MTRKTLAGILLLAVLVLTGCGWKGTGVVVEKTYSPAYDYVSFICSSYNAQGMCVVQVPITNHVPESYGYNVREDGTGKIHGVTVNYEYWSTHDVGTKFDNRDKK